MSRNRKYPKTTGWYVYKHILPNAMYYPGMSKQQPSKRWQPSGYKGKSLYPYIEEFGWDNIEHVIVADGLTKEEAEQLENQLIQEGKRNGLCINKNNSGGYRRDHPKEYKREYDCKRRQTEEYKTYQREYEHNRYQNDPEYREKKKEHSRNRYQNDPEYREHRREYSQRPEVKEREREYQREYKRNRYQNDPEYKERVLEQKRQYRLKKKLSNYIT